MKSHHHLLLIAVLALAVFPGCRTERDKGPGSPHLATRYELDSTWGDGQDYEIPTTVAGGWFNIGEAPGVYLEITSSGEDFLFDNPYPYVSTAVMDYHVTFFTRTGGGVVQQGFISGGSITWTSGDWIDTASFLGSWGGPSITGTFNLTWFGVPQTHNFHLVPVQALFGNAVEQPLNSEAEYTISGDGGDSPYYQTVRVNLNQASSIVQAQTFGNGINTWLWLFNSDGEYVRSNRLRNPGDGSQNATSVVTMTLHQGEYYYVVTTFNNNDTTVRLQIAQPGADI